MNNKYFYLFFLIALVAYGQNPFDTKKKNQNKGTQASELRLQKLQLLPLGRYELHHEKVIKSTIDLNDSSFIFIENFALQNSKTNQRKTLEETQREFVNQIPKELKGIKFEDLQLVSSSKDVQGNLHLKYLQTKNGIEVYGGELFFHLTKGKVKSLNGHLYQPLENNQEANISEERAIQLALQHVSQESLLQEAGMTGAILNLQKNTARKIYYPFRGTTYLAYETVVRPNLLERWVYFIDALEGKVIDRYAHTCTLDGVFKTRAKDLNGKQQEIIISQVGANYFLIDPSKSMFDAQRSEMPNNPVGAIWTIDANNSRINERSFNFSHVTSTDGLSWSPSGVSAHFNASLCYDYYEKTFKRNSLNNGGGTIISVINIADEDGGGMDNAYWNGEFMGYGNGRDGFKPLAGALDVAGHEMTHGVIENTAKLEYRNQSGAMNESFADIFGAMIDREDWTLGEDVVKTSVFPSGALRSLSNPNQGGRNDPGYQPKNMSQYVFLRDIPSEDNGGVHVNSGITNHAYYLFATSPGMSKEKAEQVFYHTLTNYLTRTSKFLDLRLGVIQSARDLYGNNEAQAAANAFDAVGIVANATSSQPTNTTTEIPVNTGKQFVMVYEPQSGNMYNGSYGAESNFQVIANGIGCLKKPSITDNGALAVWVGNNKDIYAKNLTNTSAVSRITNSGNWANVAISKDGRRLAAIPDDGSASIVVFDLERNTQKVFELYNPTYTSGVTTGEVQYADAMEWDYSGEFLIYDAFNKAGGVFGSIEYWDVGILRAWNPIQKTYGDGTIEKLFTDLDAGDNIGNPAIAKTNPNVIAFDYLNAADNSIYVLAVDLENGKVSGIVENNEIGFPDYTVDDKAMSYNSQQNGIEVAKIIPLNADRISASGTGQRLFSGGSDKWAVFYAQGERILPEKKAQTIAVQQISDKNQGDKLQLKAEASSKLPVQFSLKSGDASLLGTELTCGNTPGKVIFNAFQIGNNEFASQQVDASFCIKPTAPTLSSNGSIATASGNLEVQWYLNGNAIQGVTTNRNFNMAGFNGSFQARSVTEDGCYSDLSNSLGNTAVLSTGRVATTTLKLFPNPISGIVQVTRSEQKVSGFIIDSSGNRVLSFKNGSFNSEKLGAGAFILEDASNGDRLKFVKN